MHQSLCSIRAERTPRSSCVRHCHQSLTGCAEDRKSIPSIRRGAWPQRLSPSGLPNAPCQIFDSKHTRSPGSQLRAATGTAAAVHMDVAPRVKTNQSGMQIAPRCASSSSLSHNHHIAAASKALSHLRHPPQRTVLQLPSGRTDRRRRRRHRRHGTQAALSSASKLRRAGRAADCGANLG